MSPTKRAKAGGRKVGSVNKVTRELREVAGKYTAEAIERIVAIMREGESDAVRLQAAGMLLDRGHGRPAQSLAPAEGSNGAITIRWLSSPDAADPTA